MSEYARRTKRYKWILAFVAFLLIGLLVGVNLRKGGVGKVGQLTEPLQKGAIAESVYGIGTVFATQSFQLKPGVTSIVRKLYVKEGDQVKAGDPLVDLDGVLFRARFAGTITFLPVKESETVFAQSIVLSLVDLSNRYVLVSLEQRGAIRVQQGQKARLSFENMRDKAFTGIVQSVYTHDNNFLVRIGVDGLPAQLLPGMTGDIAVIVLEKPDVLLVPVAAIQDDKVWVSRDLKSIPIDIKIGLIDGAFAEVLSGDLKPGDRLVLARKN